MFALESKLDEFSPIQAFSFVVLIVTLILLLGGLFKKK